MNNDNVINLRRISWWCSRNGEVYGILDLLGCYSWGDVCDPLGSCCQPNGLCTYVASQCVMVWAGNARREALARFPAVHHSACAASRMPLQEAAPEADCSDLGGRSVETKPGVPTSTAAKNSTTSALMPSPFQTGSGFFDRRATTSGGLTTMPSAQGRTSERCLLMCGSLTPRCAGHLRLSTCNSASFDTDLVVYEGNCFQKTQVGCNGDNESCDDFTSELTCPVQQDKVFDSRWWLGKWQQWRRYSLIECEDLVMGLVP